MSRLLIFMILFATTLTSSLIYLIINYQDADFTVYFYKKFGADPNEVLRGKVVWITGASSGIGEALAYKFVKHGSKLVLSARRVKELERVKGNCIALAKKLRITSFNSQDVMVLPLDLQKYDTHKALAGEVIKSFKQVDILVNNAAIFQLAWAKNLPLAIDKKLVDTNYLGTVSITKAVLPHMIERKSGHIAVVNSGVGKHGYPLCSSYSATKFALKGYFESLRLELLTHNIEVSSMFLGTVSTDIWGKAHTSTPGKSFQEIYKFPEGFLQFMTPERCSELMTTVIVNGIEESWITAHPELASLYLTQYTPGFYKWFSKAVIYPQFAAGAAAGKMPPP